MNTMNSDLKKLPVTLHDGEEIRFIRQTNTRKFYIRLIIDRVILMLLILGTIYMIYYTQLSLGYIILGIVLILFECMMCRVGKRLYISRKESKLFITNQRVIFRWVYDRDISSPKFNTCYIDNIITVDKVAENGGSGIWITVSGGGRYNNLKFSPFDNVDEAMKILSPIVAQKHRRYD